MTASPAPPWLRIAAIVYDLLPLIALWMLTVALSLLAVHGDIDVAHPPATFHLVQQLAVLAVTAAYFVVSWTRGGQTIGMRPWRLRVVAAGGGALPWPRALLRFCIALVSLGAFGLGFAWCLLDGQRRGWHDLAAGSLVVRMPAK